MDLFYVKAHTLGYDMHEESWMVSIEGIFQESAADTREKVSTR